MTESSEMYTGKQIFTVVGLREEVANKIRLNVLSQNPRDLIETAKPRSISWKEKSHLFFWGSKKWRCTILEGNRGEVDICLLGLKRNSDRIIEDGASFWSVARWLKNIFRDSDIPLLEPEQKIRSRPYKKPRGRVYNPILGRMVRRSPDSRLRAWNQWSGKEAFRKAQLSQKKAGIKKEKEARRRALLAIYEAACRERERIWKEKGIDEDFGRSKQWQKARKQVIKEWQGVCAVCCLKIEGLIHIHHIHPKGKFPEKALEFENLAPVHASCHAKIHSSKPAKVHERAIALKRVIKPNGPRIAGL